MPVQNQVILDVGGTIFKTSKSTLTKYEGMLKTMMETDIPIALDDSGSIFIDRSPKHFEKVLNYMRDGAVDLPNSKKEIEELRREADYYLLAGLVEMCTETISLPNNFEIRYLGKSCESIMEAFMGRTKEAILIVYYHPDASLKGAAKMSYILNEYGGKFDVYFTNDKGNANLMDPDEWEFSFSDSPESLQYRTESGVLKDLKEFVRRREDFLTNE